MIPVGIKIFKLIVNEFANEFEKDELAEDDDDEDDEVIIVLFLFSNLILRSRFH